MAVKQIAPDGDSVLNAALLSPFFLP